MSSLTPQEAADLLGVTVKTLHRWEADDCLGQLYGRGTRPH